MGKMQRKCYQILLARQLQVINVSKKKVPNDKNVPEVYLNARDNFRVKTFYTKIVDKRKTEMKKRGEVYKKIAKIFLSDVPQDETALSTHIERYFE